MSRTFDPVHGYEVGYKKPPASGQFSKTNQPIRKPRVLPARPKITVLELEEETVPVTGSDGHSVLMAGGQVMREKLVERALRGSIRDMRELNAQIDAEDDGTVKLTSIWLNQPDWGRKAPPNDVAPQKRSGPLSRTDWLLAVALEWANQLGKQLPRSFDSTRETQRRSAKRAFQPSGNIDI